MRALARRLLFAAGGVPRYVTVGQPNPQHAVRVTLEGWGPPRDVTRNHVVASLQPLSFVAALDAGGRGHERATSLVLRFTAAGQSGESLGRICLEHDGAITADGALQLFRATTSTNDCLRGAPAVLFRLWRAWVERNHRPRPTYWISARDLRTLQVVYACPRPVVLVSVEYGLASSLFPMDLAGPTDGPWFVVALRNSSTSVALMKESARFTVADVPLELAAAQRLGAPRKELSVDWAALPFETTPSSGHRLRVPRAALRVRDVEVRQVHVVGSHTVFITRVVHEERRSAGLQMAGVSGSYYRYLRRRGIDLPLASVAPGA
jgi:flavin reductase (DIM6/NTAB) family NADH-FMN oxidoreductase RutF